MTRRGWAALTLAGASAARTARAGVLEDSFVLDTHCDTPMRFPGGFDLGRRNDYGQLDIPRMRDGGVTGVFFSIYISSPGKPDTPGSVVDALEIIDSIVRETARHPDDLILATSPSAVARAKKDGKIAVLMGVEGGHMIDSNLGVLRMLYQLGARYMTLTHSAHTPWAGSSGGSSEDDPGLTSFGRSVVAQMNDLGMMVDVSHISDKTFGAVMEATRTPVIASHSSCRVLASHPRNMTDAMIRKVADGGGVVHINYYGSFLDDDHRRRASETKQFDALQEKAEATLNGQERAREVSRINLEKVEHVGRVSFDRLLDHFEHAAKVGGVEAVGMGSDFDGVSEDLPKGMEDISKIPSLVDGLKGRGFSDADVSKMLGGNTMRVFRDIESAARKG